MSLEVGYDILGIMESVYFCLLNVNQNIVTLTEN